MRYLSLGEIVDLHQLLLNQTGGLAGIRDLGGLESALAQPRATFDGADLHPTIIQKAAALAFSLALNHPFVDGNKRVALGVEAANLDHVSDLWLRAQYSTLRSSVSHRR
jgi:death-on-curing protein